MPPLIVTPKILPNTEFTDHRGSIRKLDGETISSHFPSGPMDEYVALSRQNVFRGFHRQSGGAESAKVFYVLQGRVDMYILEAFPSKNSVISLNKFTLEPDTGSLFVPAKFFTGYFVASENALVLARGSAEYSPAHEETFPPALVFTTQEMKTWILSEKDSI
jgi:dTDP-4-dehydrorhamnose 3,5-epimerase-like enzyme